MDERAPSAGLAWHIVWLLSLLGAASSVGTFSTWLSAILRPHAFGARDGQGAAGLAALILLGSLVVALVTSGVTAWATWKLHRRRVRYAVRLTLVVLGLAASIGVALPHLP